MLPYKQVSNIRIQDTQMLNTCVEKWQMLQTCRVEFDADEDISTSIFVR